MSMVVGEADHEAGGRPCRLVVSLPRIYRPLLFLFLVFERWLIARESVFQRDEIDQKPI